MCLVSLLVSLLIVMDVLVCVLVLDIIWLLFDVVLNSCGLNGRMIDGLILMVVVKFLVGIFGCFGMFIMFKISFGGVLFGCWVFSLLIMFLLLCSDVRLGW